MYLIYIGGQIAMLFDINRRYPRAYVHRHKLHTRTAPFKAVGQSEIVMLVGMIDSLVEGEAQIDPQKITIANPSGGCRLEFALKPVYSKPPHITADNFFSSDAMMDWLGGKGYGMTATCARDRIPKEIKPYTHHTKVDATHPRCKAMRYENPVVAIKQCKAENDNKKAYTKTFVSFQSTGGTNIIGVNNLLSVKLYVGQKERGRKKDGSKRVYGIEQNEARELYLGHYYGLDNADHMIKNTGNRYITWKYWHAPYLHAQSLGIIAAYDMYIECCEGGLDASWAVDVKKRMSFSQFRIKLSEQMLGYNPVNNLYPGDKTFRISTKTHKARRKSDEDERVGLGPSAEGVTMDHYKAALESGRICSTLDEIRKHFAGVYADKGNNQLACEACGKKTIWRCGLCAKAMCTTRNRAWSGGTCIFTFHSHEFFGLSRSDRAELEGKDLRGWTPPNTYVMSKNARKINRWKRELADMNENNNGA